MAPSRRDLFSLTALVLVGGLGTRLRPVTGGLPKVLVSVAGRPFLDHLLSYLRDQGVSDVVLCTGHASERVADYCGSGERWGLRIHCSVEHKPLGTGGAIKNAGEFISSSPFLVLNGDSLVRADLAQLVQFHGEKRAQISMVLVKVEEQKRFGAVLLGKGDSIVGFEEKGRDGSGTINAGIYLFERSVLESIPAEGCVSVEKDVFPLYAGKGLYGFIASRPFIDIGTPDSLALAQTILTARSA